MLLYAKTQEEIQPDAEIHALGHVFWVKTLDLNQEFADISYQLDEITKLL